jgi:N-acyl-D-amino-acid deacylase
MRRGEGNNAVEGDLGITGDRISAIGRLASASARLTLETTRAAVTLGFIDLHSHADLAALN